MKTHVIDDSGDFILEVDDDLVVSMNRAPKCFGRYSEDEQGRTSVECDYCGQYEECVKLSMARATREHIIERDRELLEALSGGSKKVRLSFSTARNLE